MEGIPMFGFEDDEDEESSAQPAQPDYSSMAGSNKQLDPTVRADMVKKFFGGTDPSVTRAREQASANSFGVTVAQGLGQMFGGKVNPGTFDGLRRQSQVGVQDAESDAAKQRGLYKYLIDKDDNLSAMSARNAQAKAAMDQRATLARESSTAADARQATQIGATNELKRLEIGSRAQPDRSGSWVASGQVDEGGNVLLMHNKTGEFKIGPKAGTRTVDTTRADAFAEKKQKEDELINIPDHDRVEGMRVTPTDASKMRAAKATVDTLTANLDEFQNLVKNQGSFEFGGEGGGKMKSLHTTILMDAKNLYELGVLNGPDLAILSSQIGDPESLGSMFTRDKTALSGLSQTSQTVKQRFNDRMAASGYAPRNKAPAKQGGQSVPSGTAIAAPAKKTLEEMTDEELAAELGTAP